MEKTSGAGASAGSRWEIRSGVCAAVFLCAACPAAWAQDAASSPADALLAESRSASPVRVQVEASRLPRLEWQDSGFQAPRVDLSLFPGRSSSGLGAMVGMSGFSGQQGLQPAGLLPPQRPSVDLGVRFSHRLQSHQIDVMAWRRMSEPDAYTLVQRQQPVYGARVEMNLSSRKSGLAASLGFVGLQLESGARISIKRRNGGPMIYYRTTF